MSDKIRIASVYRTLRTGGDESRLLAFARALDRSRFDHFVVVVFPPDPERDHHDGPILAEYREAGVEVIHLEDRPERWQEPWFRPAIGVAAGDIVRRLARLLRERRVDVLDARLAGAIPLCVAAGKLAGTPVIVGAQYNFAGFDTASRKILAETCWPFLDTLVCDSQLRLDEMRAFLRRPPPGSMIHNGIFPPASKLSVAEARRALKLPDEPGLRVVGQVGTLLRFKGYDVLLEAAARVLKEVRDVAFLCVGFPREPGYLEELRAKAAALGIADRVRIGGYDGPIADVWQAIDLHAHASRFDSAPQTIVESMSLGKPAVVTSVGGIPDVVDPGVTAIMVPPGDPRAFADGLLRLLRDPAEAARLGAAARRKYERDYRAERMAREWEGLFERLLRDKRSGQQGGAR